MATVDSCSGRWSPPLLLPHVFTVHSSVGLYTFDSCFTCSQYALRSSFSCWYACRWACGEEREATTTQAEEANRLRWARNTGPFSLEARQRSMPRRLRTGSWMFGLSSRSCTPSSSCLTEMLQHRREVWRAGGGHHAREERREQGRGVIGQGMDTPQSMPAARPFAAFPHRPSHRPPPPLPRRVVLLGVENGEAHRARGEDVGVVDRRRKAALGRLGLGGKGRAGGVAFVCTMSKVGSRRHRVNVVQTQSTHGTPSRRGWQATTHCNVVLC